MKSEKQIFLLYSCGANETSSSMTLIMATTSKSKMRRFIADKISSAEIVYDGEESNVKAAATQFKKDWDSLTRKEINNRLEGMYVDYAYDGKEI